jgi:ABC-type branched-subunit amino acid transport system substrate-binding protein
LAVLSGVVMVGTVPGMAGAATPKALGSTPPAITPCAIPAKATTADLNSTTGVTSKSVTVGNVSIESGPIAGLFAGAPVGVRAYFAYVNAHGGVYGRTLKVTAYDDGFNSQQNKIETAQAVANNFALVGSFSLFDSSGCQALAAAPAMADVSETLDTSTSALPSELSVDPTFTGWQTGPFLYFKQHYPKAIRHVAGLAGNVTTAIDHWLGIRGAMQSLGYKIVYSRYTNPLETDFTADIIAMRQAGVQLLDITAESVTTDALIIQDMDQQNWHPMLVTSGGPIYDNQFVRLSGGANAVDEAASDGVWLDSGSALYLGQDAKSIPAVKTFDHWVQVASPGYHTDLYSLFGWTSAQLFVQALRDAGPNPTRGKVLAALRNVTSFNASGILATANPAGKVPATCYLLAKVVNGQFVRVADPPRGGFRCDGSYYYVGGGR